jgi:hypothetical protein
MYLREGSREVGAQVSTTYKTKFNRRQNYHYIPLTNTKHYSIIKIVEFMAGLKVLSIGLSPTIVFLHQCLKDSTLPNFLLQIKGQTMNKLILSTLLAAGLCGCITEYEEIDEDYLIEIEKDYQLNNYASCIEYAKRHNKFISLDYSTYTPVQEYGIYLDNGIYLANWHRAATAQGVKVQFELYLDNRFEYNDDHPQKFYITYRFSAVDTFFTDLWTDEIRLYNNTLTALDPREICIDKYKLEILSIAVDEAYCDSTVHSNIVYYEPIPRNHRVNIWEGSIVVEGNNDYIRKMCEKGHACEGYVGGGIGTLCNDGWVSGSTGSGTCSWHGGIMK